MRATIVCISRYIISLACFYFCLSVSLSLCLSVSLSLKVMYNPINRSYCYNRFHCDSEREEITHEIIEEILQSFSNEIDSKWIASLNIPIATEIAMNKLLSIVHLAMFPHDGVIEKEKNEKFEYFQPDNEPKPCPIDNWARGASKFIYFLLLHSLKKCSSYSTYCSK
jgi:hypothetical protein